MDVRPVNISRSSVLRAIEMTSKQPSGVPQLTYPRFYVRDRDGHTYAVGRPTLSDAEAHWRFCEQHYPAEAPHTIVRVDYEDAPDVDVTPKRS